MRERRADKGTSGTAWVQCRPGSGRMVPSNSRSRGQALPTTPGVCNCKTHHENTCGANYSLAILRSWTIACCAKNRRQSQPLADHMWQLPLPRRICLFLIRGQSCQSKRCFRRFQSLVRMAAPCPARWHDAKYRRSSCFHQPSSIQKEGQ